DVKYPDTCKLAKELNIRINTVQCGSHPQTRKYWEEICKLGRGSYVQIAQNGGVVAIDTPYDKELATINGELTRSTLVYGNHKHRARGKEKKADAEGLKAPAAAERAAYAAKSGRVATYDLLDSINDGKVRLEKIKREHLPAEMQKM